MSKKILVISQYFYPENFRINDLVLELEKRDYDITVLTGLPNYPTGEYFQGYSTEKCCDENWKGVQIYRCKLRARSKGTLNLIRNYISFVIQAKRKMKEIKDDKFDAIYVFEVSPITVALPAISYKKKKHTPIIMNVQDLWPENIIAVTGMNNAFINFLIKIVVRYIYKNCDSILAASQSFVPNIQSYLKTGKEKVKFWPQYSVVKKEEKAKNLFDVNYFNIIFTGNIGVAQGLDIAIEAAQQLRNTNIHWHFVGDGRCLDDLKKSVRESNLDHCIKFYGRKEEKEIPQYLANADAALLILKPDPVFEMTIPAKLQTYMACGVPIIGCVSGEGKRMIEESKSGVVSSNISVEGLVDVCNRMLSMSKEEYAKLSMNSYEYGKKHFDKKIIIDQLVNEIGGLCNEFV